MFLSPQYEILAPADSPTTSMQPTEAGTLYGTQLDRETIYTLLEAAGHEEIDASQTDEAVRQRLGISAALVATAHGEAAEAYRRYIDLAERDLPLTQAAQEAVGEKLRGRRVMVIGATGVVGTGLTKELAGLEPSEIIAVSRGQHQVYEHYEMDHGVHEGPTQPHVIAPRKGEMSDESTRTELSYKECDISDAESLEALIKEHQPDIIFHVAAQRYPDIAEQDVALTARTNILGTMNVINAARKAGVKQVVYTSTGKNEQMYPGGIQEDGTVQTNIYHATKNIVEEWLTKEATKGDMLISGIRFTHVVDDSNILVKLHEWIEQNEQPSMHDMRFNFFGQSVRECVKLCTLASVAAERGKFNMLQIRDLGVPFELGDLAVGAMISRDTLLPIRIVQNPAGYKTGVLHPPFVDRKPFATIQPSDGSEPITKGDVSPLVGLLDLDTAHQSELSSNVDEFTMAPQDSEAFDKALDNLVAALENEDATDNEIRGLLQICSLFRLDARIAAAPQQIQQRMTANPEAAMDGLAHALREGMDTEAVSDLMRQFAQEPPATHQRTSAPAAAHETGVDGHATSSIRQGLGAEAILSALSDAALAMEKHGASRDDTLPQVGALAYMRR